MRLLGCMKVEDTKCSNEQTVTLHVFCESKCCVWDEYVYDSPNGQGLYGTSKALCKNCDEPIRLKEVHSHPQEIVRGDRILIPIGRKTLRINQFGEIIFVVVFAS